MAALVTLNPTSVYPGWRAWMPCGATALLIWAGTGRARSPVTGVLSTRPLCYMGDISYSLYLTHYACLELIRQSPLSGFWGWRLIAIGACALSATSLYHFLENPVRRSGWLAADRIAVVLVLGVCIAASWTAAIAVATLSHTA